MKHFFVHVHQKYLYAIHNLCCLYRIIFYECSFLYAVVFEAVNLVRFFIDISQVREVLNVNVWSICSLQCHIGIYLHYCLIRLKNTYHKVYTSNFLCNNCLFNYNTFFFLISNNVHIYNLFCNFVVIIILLYCFIIIVHQVL